MKLRFIKCPYCNGEGGEEEYVDEYIHWWEDCYLCKATGKVTLRAWFFYKFDEYILEWYDDLII